MALTKAQRDRIERYDRDNRESASIILADIKKYGGEGAGVVRWALTVRSKLRSKPESTWPEGDLFDQNETAESVCLSAV